MVNVDVVEREWVAHHRRGKTLEEHTAHDRGQMAHWKPRHEDLRCSEGSEGIVPETPDQSSSERSFEFPLSGPKWIVGPDECMSERSFEFPLWEPKRLEDHDELEDESKEAEDESKDEDEECTKSHEDEEGLYKELERTCKALREDLNTMREDLNNMRKAVAPLIYSSEKSE